MTNPAAPPAPQPPAPPPAAHAAPPRQRLGVVPLRAALVVVGALALLGVLLGLVWSWWSPSRPIGFVIAAHAVQPDETESFVAGDGRFAALTLLAGLAAATAVWFIRTLRGPLAVVALGAGGLLGAWLTERVGHALGGGSATGPAQTLINHLPLELHMRGLLVIEAAIAVLAYGLFVAFAASDDLDVDGRPGGVDDVASVGFGAEPQDRWRHGDAAGALHEPYLAPQYPDRQP